MGPERGDFSGQERPVRRSGRLSRRGRINNVV